MQDQGAQMGPPLGPSDIGPLFEMLKAALSNDGGTRKQAEAAMKSMELRQGFCSCLLVSSPPPCPSSLSSSASSPPQIKSPLVPSSNLRWSSLPHFSPVTGLPAAGFSCYRGPPSPPVAPLAASAPLLTFLRPALPLCSSRALRRFHALIFSAPCCPFDLRDGAHPSAQLYLEF